MRLITKSWNVKSVQLGNTDIKRVSQHHPILIIDMDARIVKLENIKIKQEQLDVRFVVLVNILLLRLQKQ